MSQPLPHTEHASTPTAKPAARPRRWLRFSLRTFLLFTLVLGVLFGWLGNILVRVRKQREVVARIEEAGGRAYYDYQLAGEKVGDTPPPGPRLVRLLVGDDAFAYVKMVHFQFRFPSVTDEELKWLAELPRLESVSVHGNEISERGLSYLSRLQRLQELTILESNVSAEGLATLANVKTLRELKLHGPQVNDDSIKTIDRLKNLTSVELSETSITSGGLAPFSRLTNLKRIAFSSTLAIGDAALNYFVHLDGLNDLSLRGAAVTDRGMEAITKFRRLRRLNLRKCAISDIGACRLRELPELEDLYLSDTKIGNGALSACRELKRLRFLDVQRTSVTDEGLLHLRGLERLELVMLGPSVSDAAATALSRDLPKSRIQFQDSSGKSVLLGPPLE